MKYLLVILFLLSCFCKAQLNLDNVNLKFNLPPQNKIDTLPEWKSNEQPKLTQDQLDSLAGNVTIDTCIEIRKYIK